MSSEVVELITALRNGTMNLEEVAQRFRERTWPRRTTTPTTSYLELAASAQQDPEPDIPGSFDEVTQPTSRVNSATISTMCWLPPCLSLFVPRIFGTGNRGRAQWGGAFRPRPRNYLPVNLTRKFCQLAIEMTNFGPSGSLESRTATIPGRFCATSTHAPFALL